MATLTYTTVAKVKRILRSNVQKRVNFSGYYRNLGGEIDNTSGILLSSVSFYNDYANSEKYTLEFTDTTSFSISSIDESTGTRGTLNLGNGTVYDDFTTSTGLIIEADNWSGYPAVGADKVVFSTEVHMSIDDLEQYIIDTEIWVDSELKKKIYQDTTVALNTLMFSSGSVPSEIEFATTRLAAFMVFNDVFNANIDGMQAGSDGLLQSIPVNNWFKLGMDMLATYIENYVSGEVVSSPLWYSWRKLMKVRGIPDVGLGIAVPKQQDAPSLLYDGYDDLLDPDTVSSTSDELEE